MNANDSSALDSHVEADKTPLVPISLPKAEMHIHIALALAPEVFLRRIQKGRTSIHAEFLIERSHRYYDSLAQHHATYEAMRHITSTQSELAQVAQDYLERIAREGAIYAELSLSFRDPDLFESQIDALEEAIRCARANTGIEARIVVTSIRNMGSAHAEMAARHLAAYRREFVTGFGLAGEEKDAFSSYEKALHIAWHDAGLGLAPHVAEQYLHNAIDFLHTVPKEALSIPAGDHRRLRAGHGTLIHMSTQLLDLFAAHSVCMEICLSANKRIGLPAETRAHTLGERIGTVAGRDVVLDQPLRQYFKNLPQHPMRLFTSLGIPVCQGSDNPLLQNTNIGKENSLAVKSGLTDVAGCLEMTANAVRFANVDSSTRATLMAKVDMFRAAMKSGDVPSVTPFGYQRAFGVI